MPPFTLAPAVPTETEPTPCGKVTLPPFKSLTQTRKFVNAQLVEDYRNNHTELRTAVQRVRELVKSKEDLEVLALVSNITLPNLGDIA